MPDACGIQPLPRDFYRGDPREVAPRLLGQRFCRRLGGEVLAGRIVEVEAYLSSGDFAAHHQRPRSKANESLYLEPGTCYVYQLRQHYLVNVVAVEGAILFRAIEPTLGVATMKKNRGTEDLRRLAAGPGRLCQALGITRDLDGYDFTLPGGELWLAAADPDPDFEIVASKRIGISKSTDFAFRYVIAGSPYLSAPP